MINCQERVSCQLASDLFVLCPNHLLRGKKSCLSCYNSLYIYFFVLIKETCHGVAYCSQRLDIAPTWHPFAICLLKWLKENADSMIVHFLDCGSMEQRIETSFHTALQRILHVVTLTFFCANIYQLYLWLVRLVTEHLWKSVSKSCNIFPMRF